MEFVKNILGAAVFTYVGLWVAKKVGISNI